MSSIPLPSARVLMAVPQYPYPVVGGMERQAHELAKALSERGLDVQALSGRIGPDQPAQERVDGVLVHRIPWSARKWVRFVRAPVDLLRTLHARRHTYDVVHVHQFSWFGLFVILIARILGKPVLTKLLAIGEHGLPGLVDSRLGAVKLAIFKQTDAVVAMCAESVGELSTIGFPLGSVLRTPNGIRVLQNSPSGNAGIASAGACRVVFVGRLTSEKRIEDLLHVWRRIADSGNRIDLELWGTGPLETELVRLCQNLGIERSVMFRGHVDSVRDKLPDMDILVLPSASEGNSNAILEAMAAGLPVVSTRVGGTPMLVGREGSRFLFDAGDREALYCHLRELIEDENLRKSTGRLMYQRVLAHFDICRVSRTYEAAYALLHAGRGDELDGISDPVVTEY